MWGMNFNPRTYFMRMYRLLDYQMNYLSRSRRVKAV